ncbi:hypothetical protein [Deinococcus multiflagellatus]|uniref:Uncharacterized protein n=1 Tax=Deinococcus multiflagellatus TaxID=1656887 RepID=A0ABW1ZP78_9DEIO|nr:hypothetical protein [Deinococcus multiflagellatus]MBZ9715846.1 hypothetical protein [Deinococcus multiflagellatus]
MSVLATLRRLKQQAAACASSSQAMPLTGTTGLIAELEGAIANLCYEGRELDGSVQLHVEDILTTFLTTPEGGALNLETGERISAALLCLVAQHLTVREFEQLRAGYGLGRTAVTLYEDEGMSLQLRAGQPYLSINGGARVCIEGQIHQQFAAESGASLVPLIPPLPYTVTAGPAGPDIEFWHHQEGAAADERAGNAHVVTEYGYGHLRVMCHGREREELCEVVLDTDSVNLDPRASAGPAAVGRAWLSEQPASEELTTA